MRTVGVRFRSLKSLLNISSNTFVWSSKLLYLALKVAWVLLSSATPKCRRGRHPHDILHRREKEREREREKKQQTNKKTDRQTVREREIKTKRI